MTRIWHASICANYEMRHCWQASSIDQQVHPKGSDFEVVQDVAYVRGLAHPWRYPDQSIWYPTDYEVMARRGEVRNEQIERARAAGAGWLFFGDADNVYPPDYFASLAALLEGRLAKTFACVTSIPHFWHTEVGAAENLMWSSVGKGELYIQNAYERARMCKKMRKRIKRRAAGNCQIVRLEAIDERCDGVYYHKPTKDRYHNDRHMFKALMRANSDVVFRQNLEGVDWIDLPDFIHLQHRRDQEERRHLEEQR